MSNTQPYVATTVTDEEEKFYDIFTSYSQYVKPTETHSFSGSITVKQVRNLNFDFTTNDLAYCPFAVRFKSQCSLKAL